jgi:hypothetical protein
LARQLAQAGGTAVRAVLLYGSQLLRAQADRHSAYDFVVIVEDYRSFYAASRAAGELRRPVGLMTWMANLLPPNVIAFAPDGGREGIAKCLIVSSAHLERALGADPMDHFLLGRMVQRVEVVWSASAHDVAWTERQLAGARARVLNWMAPYLDGPIDAERLGRRLLEVCYQGELRPEAKDRAATIFESQAEHFRSVFPAVLEQGVVDGVLERAASSDARPAGPVYRLARPVAAADQRRWRRHFRRSKRRATARWFKHMITFANWLPYIVRKVERHTGRAIELTPLERKLPLIFLWPRAIHVLLSRPQRPPSGDRGATNDHDAATRRESNARREAKS